MSSPATTGGLSVALLAGLALPAAADLDYPDFSSTAGLTFVGAAQAPSTLIQLTPNAAYTAGAVWSDDKQVLVNGFDTTFELRMTPAGGADGMAFVIQNQDLAALANCGGAMGYSQGTSAGCAHGVNQDIANAVAVEFDIWSNGEYGDSDNNHISVHSQQTGSNELVHHNNSHGQMNMPNDLNDGAPHMVRVAYDGVGQMDVYWDDLTTPALSVQIDLEQAIQLDNGAAHVGFTAATGGATQIHAVTEWKFTESSGFLIGTTDQLSLGTGGTCDFTLSAGAQQAGQPYLLMGTHSGTSPGIPIDLVQTLPLNIDAYWQHTLTSPNTPPLTNSFGTLDLTGRATASFTLPPGVNPLFAGIQVSHAFVSIDPLNPGGPAVSYTSDAHTFTFAP